MNNSYKQKIVASGCLSIIFLVITVLYSVASAQESEKNKVSLELLDKTHEWFKVAENIYQFRYQHHYTLFVTTLKGIVAFDPLSDEAAEHYVAAMNEAAPGQPLLAIIYTHWHIDHSIGARVLRREYGDGVPIIAHERTLSRLKQWDDPAIPLPTETISDKGRMLQYGDQKIELNYIGYGHTDSMLVARFPKQRLVFVVDFANNDAVGWTDLPGWYIGELIVMQRRLLKMDFESVAFGHGMPGDKATIKRQIGYYENLTNNAMLALEQGLSEDEAVALIEPKMQEYKDWRFYNDWFLQNIRGAYRWAETSN